jgi:hypothetical protein
VKRTLATIAAMLACAALPGPAAARTVTSGVITVGQGAGPITLGMTRARVISKLGKPLYENGNGYMQYANIPVIFDVYRNGGAKSSRVRMVSVSDSGPAFSLSDGNRIFTKGGLKRLAARYGKRLKFHQTADAGPFYEIVTRLNGRKVLTDFDVDRRSLNATVLQIFILYA